ncbi:adventurous-gliding motility protein Z [Anaeromyxobacter sp. PSR-1]|nr:adventurous-gliding motility protein Z [Anaeromyxobacter sp. PSR-1]
MAAAGQARARAEKDLAARAAEAARRLDQLGAERREAEGRAARAVEEAQARFREELQRRDQARAQELARLQAALQERARREKALELEVARLRGGRNVATPAASGVAPAEAAPAAVKDPVK